MLHLQSTCAAHILPLASLITLPWPQIKLADANLCMEVEGGSHGDGAAIQVGSGCSGGDHQLWAFEAYGDAYRLRVKHTGKCFYVAGGNPHDGTRLEVFYCQDLSHMIVQLAAGE